MICWPSWNCGAAMCAVAKILKIADQAGDICGYRAFWHCLPPTKNPLKKDFDLCEQCPVNGRRFPENDVSGDDKFNLGP